MIDCDSVPAKVAIIRRCLDRIRSVTGMDPASLDDIDRQDIVVLNPQRAVRSAIDLGAHTLAAHGYECRQRRATFLQRLSDGGFFPLHQRGQCRRCAVFALSPFMTIATFRRMCSRRSWCITCSISKRCYTNDD
ncbi:MAG: hypothetical protein KatS3mg058_2337 [Roseiflexus sp.]|nr:MAG: hypothetical protein KatS3mg058_2337 [Roseiflexus sp.]